MTTQLPLGITLADAATFNHFLIADNVLLLELLQALVACQADKSNKLGQSKQANTIQEQQVYLWGDAGVGKTHLLQASCHAAAAAKLRSAYLPLNQLSDNPVVLQGMDQLDIVCLDELDSIVGKPEWERALFNLINECRMSGTRLIMAALHNSKNLKIALPDLQSRLQWGPVIKLITLTDEQKCQVLQARAERKGLNLPVSVAEYMLQHYARDMRFLCDSLEKLDVASLAAGRRLTIPFVKTVLE